VMLDVVHTHTQYNVVGGVLWAWWLHTHMHKYACGNRTINNNNNNNNNNPPLPPRAVLHNATPWM